MSAMPKPSLQHPRACNAQHSAGLKLRGSGTVVDLQVQPQILVEKKSETMDDRETFARADQNTNRT